MRTRPRASTPPKRPAPTRLRACNSLGLFGGESRAVVVDGVEAWKAADVKEIEAYLASPAPDTVLVLVGDGLKKDAALAKAVGKTGEAHTYEVAKKELPQWVGEQFARLGATADRDACRALVEAVGDDVGDLSSEIQKLATWANGEPITRAAVEELAVGRAETPIFAVTDSWGSRDVAGTLRATESLLERSHRPRSGELIRIVASLVGHVGRVRKIAALADEGVRPREIASRLKVHPFVAEKSSASGAQLLGRRARAGDASSSPSSTRGRRAARGCPRIFSSSGRSSRSRARRSSGSYDFAAGSPAASFAACDLRRATVFLWRTPLETARSSQRTSSRCAVCVASASPDSAASRSRRMSVFAVERQRRFSCRCRAAWRTRFSCCLIFGIS